MSFRQNLSQPEMEPNQVICLEVGAWTGNGQEAQVRHGEWVAESPLSMLLLF